MTENKDKQATSDTTKERDKKAIGDQLEQDGDEEGAVGIHIAEPGDDEGAAALTVALPEPHERNGRTKRLSHLWEKLPLSINKKTSRSPSSSPSPTQRNHQPSQQPSHQQQPQQPQQAQQLHHYRESLLMPPSLRQMPRLGDDLWHCGRSREGSFQSEVIILDLLTGMPVHEPRDDDDHDDGHGRDEEAAENDYKSRAHQRDEYGTQRVYKKTSPNCVITLYLPSREIMLSGSGPSILRGIVFVDPKAIQGYRVYAQLTLTFRYGREDEEVMGLRFCNEAIMSLHQVWPRNEEPARESLSPLQEALVKRLGDGAHPFTLTLTSQAPPSVQLVPAKRYYGAPIGTSYDVRCFIADKTDEKFHRRASVKMGVRVIYHTDVFHQHDTNGPENFADLINSHGAGVGTPPPGGIQSASATTTPPVSASSPTDKSQQQSHSAQHRPDSSLALAAANEDSGAAGGGHDDGPSCSSGAASGSGGGKPRKSERGDSFPKLRLSPKSFRFSGRFGRSKSEIEKAPADPFAHYSKSFQEYDNVVSSCGSGGGPQGAVDKPFLLQDGRVSLRASLDKCWYTHGEDVTVTVHIRNDSRKTVRKVRVCAIQHVDVCMFNNGKFKNIVADSDATSPVDRTVPPGGSLTTTVVLRPQRGPTKNWIALEDTLQRSTEPEEITGAIAASAVRSPNFVLPPGGSNSCQSPAVCIPQHYSNISAGGASSSGGAGSCSSSANQENRNVFAIYVSYYVKVKLTLSGMGGELSLKLPFMLVHVDDQLHLPQETKLALTDVPPPKKAIAPRQKTTAGLQRVDTFDDEINIRVPATPSTSSGLTSRDSGKRRLLRSETVAKDLDEETEEQLESAEVGHLHLVEVHSAPMGVPPKARLDEEQHEMKQFSRPKAKESKEDDIFSDDEGANVADEDAEQEEKDPRPSNRTTNV